MTDVYRAAGLRCPICTDVSLRAFKGRLVCDACEGMLIAPDDLADAIHELDGSVEPIVFTDDEAAACSCPRCHRPMVACAVALGTLALAGRFLRCDGHGLWCPRDAMVATFARVSRRGGARRFGGGAAGAGAGASGQGVGSAMESIRAAFGGGPRLAVSQWVAKRPRVHTPFVSAHRAERLPCPSCATPLDDHGDRWACAACAGSFVENESLAALVMEMAQAPWALPATAGAPGDRACPICARPMLVEALEGLTIDRCGAHGVWFDATELQAALLHASGVPTAGGWLGRLLRRAGPTGG